MQRKFPDFWNIDHYRRSLLHYLCPHGWVKTDYPDLSSSW